jgi:hypothetical protein
MQQHILVVSSARSEDRRPSAIGATMGGSKAAPANLKTSGARTERAQAQCEKEVR